MVFEHHGTYEGNTPTHTYSHFKWDCYATDIIISVLSLLV